MGRRLDTKDVPTMKNTSSKSKRRCTSECGASLVECALLVALISVATIVAVKTLGLSVSEKFENIGIELEAAHGSIPTPTPIP